MIYEYLLLIIRWSHSIAAVAWIGGAIFYWLVLKPIFKLKKTDISFTNKVSSEFNKLVKLSIWVLVITGGILLTSRLAEEVATFQYVIILSIKIFLAFVMFFLVFSIRVSTSSPDGLQKNKTGLNFYYQINKPLLVMVLGIIIFFLSELLQLIVEQGLVK